MPKSVHYASVLWFIAVAAGVAETAIRVAEGLLSGAVSGGDVLPELAMRTVIYGTVVVAILAMRGGARWARWALALVLGTAGMLSLLIEPVMWVATGNSVSGLLSGADPAFYAVAAVRVVHIAAVPAALAAMFSPSANRYFRPAAAEVEAAGIGG